MRLIIISEKTDNNNLLFELLNSITRISQTIEKIKIYVTNDSDPTPIAQLLDGKAHN